MAWSRRNVVAFFILTTKGHAKPYVIKNAQLKVHDHPDLNTIIAGYILSTTHFFVTFWQHSTKYFFKA